MIFKVNLIAIVLGTNISVIFCGVKLDAAIFAFITFATIAYIIKPKGS
jgi:hypothetical protein